MSATRATVAAGKEAKRNRGEDRLVALCHNWRGPGLDDA